MDAYRSAPAPGSARDTHLFAAHDAVNVLVFTVVLALPHVDPRFLVQDYTTGKILHLLGLGWFFAGLIVAAAIVSRFVWMQPSLDHEKLAYGYRFILVLELLGIPSIALMAYGGVSMVAQVGGLEAQPWANQGYLFLLVSPPILMATPRLVHKRLIKNPDVEIERERRRAFWMDWSFIAVMTLLFAALTVSMVLKSPLFQDAGAEPHPPSAHPRAEGIVADLLLSGQTRPAGRSSTSGSPASWSAGGELG